MRYCIDDTELYMKTINDMEIMEADEKNIVLFHPHIPQGAFDEIQETLQTRWIGQGPKVEQFENEFNRRFAENSSSIAVGSCTDALHLAYILAGIKANDEVITPVFTCTATNIPLLYLDARVRFADIQKETLNIDPASIEDLINEKTRAIVCVDYGGLPCNYSAIRKIADKWNIPVIEDAAQSLGGTFDGVSVGSFSDFTAFSFQAIKHITTGDGGMLTIKDTSLTEKAKRIRWFGIDRLAKQKGIWENDIYEVGYKYQMTDIAAAMGLAALQEFDQVIQLRKQLFAEYIKGLKDVPGIKILGADKTDREHAAWICTILAENRYDLQLKLREHHIESGQVHFRNDRYSVFKDSRSHFPNMDAVEDNYLVLPIHTKMTLTDVQKICGVIRSGW